MFYIQFPAFSSLQELLLPSRSPRKIHVYMVLCKITVKTCFCLNYQIRQTKQTHLVVFSLSLIRKIWTQTSQQRKYDNLIVVWHSRFYIGFYLYFLSLLFRVVRYHSYWYNNIFYHQCSCWNEVTLLQMSSLSTKTSTLTLTSTKTCSNQVKITEIVSRLDYYALFSCLSQAALSRRQFVQYAAAKLLTNTIVTDRTSHQFLHLFTGFP